MSNLEKFKKAILRLKQEKEYTADAQIHAPKGGVTVKGKFFPGGQFIPNEGGYAEAYKKELKKEKPQEIEKVSERSSIGKERRTVSTERIEYILKQITEKTPQENKEDAVSRISEKINVKYTYINNYVRGWAETSAEDDPKALGLQLVAKDIFGHGETSHFDESKAKKTKIQEKFIKAIYDETQQWFKEQGFDPDDEIMLYRGVRDKIVDGKYSLQPLSSFSFLKKIAQEFAEEGEDGTTFVAKIPVKHIFSTPLTGIGCTNEYEAVVVGHDIDIHVVNDITIRKNSDFKKINEFDDVFIFPGLKSLKGAPKIVNGDFNCHSTYFLTSLEGAPKIVNGDFNCHSTYFLTSLEGAPEIVGGNFDCSYNDNLKSLEGAPEIVGGNFDCSYNDNLKSLDGCPKEVGGNFDCSYNDNLKSLDGCPKEVGGNFYYSSPFTEKIIRKVCNVKGQVIKR